MTALHDIITQQHNPLDIFENLAAMNEWYIDRPADDEVNMIIEGSWTDLQLSLNWREDLAGLHLACTFDLKVPGARRDEIAKLISLINAQLFIGHFDIWANEGSLMFRNGLLLSGGAEITEAQCESLISGALEACERYYPSFQFVIWAGKSASEALEASLLETVGEA